MSRGEWIALAGVAVALLIAFVPYIWRVWHWNEEKELRRIYRKAAMLGESGFIAKLRRSYRKVRGKSNQGDAMLQSLVAVIENKDFWREAIRPGSVGLVKEKEMFVQKFIELTGNHRREEIEGAVDSLYVEALNRLEIAKSSAWRKRAQGEFTRRNIDNEVSISQRMVGLNEAQEPVVLEGAKPNQLAAKQDKLQELFQWALSHDTERALRVAYELSIFLDLHGQRNEALEALRKALALVSEQGQDAPKELQFQVLNRASHLAIKQAYCDEGEKFAQRMLDLSREVTPDANMATALQRLGKSNYFRCDSQVARGMLEESLDIFQQQEPKDFRAIAWVQFDLGVLEINLDELVSARYWLEKSLTSLALHEGRDKFAEGAFRVNLAFVLHKQGNREAAHSQMAMAEELLGNDSYRRWHLHFLGRLEIAEG
ncbi:MAG: hypothetical protein QOJ02_2877, partial [Acidobacteriota bacterium]|nr:hypothetical protein [Acidobacteriota bacterium]